MNPQYVPHDQYGVQQQKYSPSKTGTDVTQSSAANIPYSQPNLTQIPYKNIVSQPMMQNTPEVSASSSLQSGLPPMVSQPPGHVQFSQLTGRLNGPPMAQPNQYPRMGSPGLNPGPRMYVPQGQMPPPSQLPPQRQMTPTNNQNETNNNPTIQNNANMPELTNPGQIQSPRMPMVPQMSMPTTMAQNPMGMPKPLMSNSQIPVSVAHNLNHFGQPRPIANPEQYSQKPSYSMPPPAGMPPRMNQPNIGPPPMGQPPMVPPPMNQPMVPPPMTQHSMNQPMAQPMPQHTMAQPMPNQYNNYMPNQLTNQMAGMQIGQRPYLSPPMKPAMNGENLPHMPPPLNQNQGFMNGNQPRSPQPMGYPPTMAPQMPGGPYAPQPSYQQAQQQRRLDPDQMPSPVRES